MGLFFPLIIYAAEQSKQRIKEFFSTSVTTMSGSIPFTSKEKDKFSLVVKQKNSVEWKEALFKTDNLTALRVSDSNFGIWSLLPSSQFKITDTLENVKKNPLTRSVKLVSGTLRMKATEGITSAEKGVAKNNLIVETGEIKIFVPHGTDFVVSRKQNSAKGSHYSTQVYVLSGKISFLPLSLKLPKGVNPESKKIPFVPGAVFSISDTGVIAPFTEPDGNEVEQVLAFTTTPEEILAKKHYAGGFKVDALIEKCEALEKNADYFEILSLFDAFKKDFKNNEQIPYCLGVASAGLNQRQDAIRYFNGVVSINPNNVDAHWHLAQIYLKDKNYAASRNEFKVARSIIDKKDKRYFQHQYYMGVLDFFEKKYLSAKSRFETCSENKNLDATLKQSARGFLAQIPIQKPWSLIVPVGLTYDNNVLAIGKNESLPASYSSKSTWKSFMGAIFDYDSSLATQDTGWFLGGEAKTFYVKNFKEQYKGLDALVVEGSLFETNRMKNKDSVRLYETSGMIFLNQRRQTYYLLGGVKYKVFDFNAGMEWDVSETPSEQKTTDTVFNQYYTESYGQHSLFLWSMNAQLQEKITKNRTAAVGNSVEAIASPQMTYILNSKSNVAFTPTFDFTWLNTDPQSSTYKFEPTLSFNYFVNQWLLGTVSGVYEYDVDYPGSVVVEKPQMTVSLTGIF